MQDENRSLSQFISRTDRLAFALGVNLTELPAALGMSERMLFGYRAGTYSISSKAWLKLEAAEAKHGVGTAATQTEPGEAETVSPEGATTNQRLARIERQIAEILRRLPPV